MIEESVSQIKNDDNEVMEIDKNLSMPLTENITILNLSGNYRGDTDLPPNLNDLNISHNNLNEIPKAVLSLKNLRILDISFNRIVKFDDKPDFCDSIEELNLSKNALIRPPYWIWLEAPTKLYRLILFDNAFSEQSYEDGYLESLLIFRTKITDVNLTTCWLRKRFLELLRTFPIVKNITLGRSDYSYFRRNHLLTLPCKGMETILRVERLIVCNTCISTINRNIKMFKELVEIDLSDNRLRDLPEEFGLLKNLKICNLSHNEILYLPDNMKMLEKLRVLLLDDNDLCMISKDLSEIECLHTLDLYDNKIYEVHEILKEKVLEIDLAQNYFDEPEDEVYKEKKEKLRLNKEPRDDGRKREIIREEYSSSSSTTEDESDSRSVEQPNNAIQQSESSSENWDTDDDNWMPNLNRQSVAASQPQQRVALRNMNVSTVYLQGFEPQFADLDDDN